MSFANLKKSSSSLDALVKKAEQATGGRSFAPDERYWKLTRDKNGNGRATIRFLPPKDGEADEFVTYMDHGFQGPSGQWYIEKSRKSLSWEEPDPVSEFLDELYALGDEGKQKINEIGCKRRKHFVSSIVVVDDPANPDNNGKVFLYEYGSKILSKLKDAMAPTFEDETAVNPYNMWGDGDLPGADFNLRVRKVDGWPNYDKSDFSDPQTVTLDNVTLDDDALEELYGKIHSLKEVVSQDQFKNYSELKMKFNRVMGITANAPQRAETVSAPERVAPTISESVVDDSSDSSDEETLAYFKGMVDDD